MLEQKVSRFDVDSEMTSVQKARASVVDISGWAMTLNNFTLCNRMNEWIKVTEPAFK